MTVSLPRSADVIVVGGGPAGTSTAYQLARRGVRVTLLDRAFFPRPKPCAECLSPQTSRILDQMDVLGELEHRGVWLRGMTVRSPDGTTARGEYAASHGFRAWRDAGLSIRREILDTVLLDRARAVGVDVIEGAHVTGVVTQPGGAVAGVEVRGSDRGARGGRVAGGVIVGADGLRSVVARRLGLWKRAGWPDRLSLVAHYEDVRDITQYGEMHVETDGFVGIADVGGGVTTVAAVFPQRRAREISRDRSRFLDAWLASRPQLRQRFARARRLGPATAVGPFAAHARRAWYPPGGALLVGDAADFFDPFTGEGIYAALRGGEMAAEAVAAALTHAASARDALREYDARRRIEFGGKWRVERMISAGVAIPRIVNRATRALAARRDLADLLVGVTGDFVPASEVLRLGYLARLLLLPVPPPSDLHARHS